LVTAAALLILICCMIAVGAIDFSLELIGIPFLVLPNVLDFRKVNANLYTRSAVKHSNVRLKLTWSQVLFCHSEEILVQVENAALAHQVASADCSSASTALHEILENREDINHILETFKSFGTENKKENLQKFKGEPTHTLQFPRFWKVLASLLQMKANAMVVIGEISFVELWAAYTFPVQNTRVTWKIYPKVKLFKTLFYTACISLFAETVYSVTLGNPYKYGTLQFYWKIIMLKRTNAGFALYWATTSCFFLFIWCIVAPYCVSYFHGGEFVPTYYWLTGKMAFLLIVNATQTRKVATFLYPMEMPSEEIFLNLKSMDFLTPAEDILERVENAYIIKVFQGDNEYLKAVINVTQYHDSLAAIYSQFGKVEDKITDKIVQTEAEEADSYVSPKECISGFAFGICRYLCCCCPSQLKTCFPKPRPGFWSSSWIRSWIQVLFGMSLVLFSTSVVKKFAVEKEKHHQEDQLFEGASNRSQVDSLQMFLYGFFIAGNALGMLVMGMAIHVVLKKAIC